MASSSEEKIAHMCSLCEKGLWADALAFAESWRAENPADAKAHFYSGVALASLGRFVEAETFYRRGLALDETDFKAWNNLAGILFEQAMKIEPQNKLGWSNLASMLGRMGRHEKALEFAGRALTIDPQMVEALLHKAAAAKALGKMEIVREVSEALATIDTDKFRRAR
jgi:tetratricopeptide (TPR) repeat protein